MGSVGGFSRGPNVTQGNANGNLHGDLDTGQCQPNEQSENRVMRISNFSGRTWETLTEPRPEEQNRFIQLNL